MQHEQLGQIVRSAGALVREAQHIEDSVREKTSPRDLVTKYDTSVQEFLRRALKEALPEAGFFGEEEQAHEIAGKRAWFIVDPIDGTTNFIHDFHHSVISLAYAEQRVTKYGIVYCPYTGEVFEARLGEGAWCNGVPMKVSQKTSLSQCLISTGTSPAYRDCTDVTFARMRRIFERCQDIRRIGSAALELSYLACGRLDGFYEEILKLWDYAAAQLMIREAGGIAVEYGEGFLAGTPKIMEELRTVIEGDK